jgi:stage V sporulation protein D (sporulation-specific penicillin-binding protein)
LAAPSVLSRKRITAVVGIATLAMLLALFRDGYWQICRADWLKEKAADQWTRERPVAPQRGSILDTNGKVLAQSASSHMVVVSPQQVATAEAKAPGARDNVVDTLTEVLKMDRDFVEKRVKDTSKSEVLIKRQISDEQADTLLRIKTEAGLPGVALSEDMTRYYAYGSFLTQVLGFTSVDGDGLEGVEASFNKYLAGTPGSVISETDARGNALPDAVEQYIPPVDGDNVQLTIDSVIQSFCESAMDKCLAEQGAKKVTCIVMDPKTGAILAMVTKPDFDNNAPPRDDMKKLQAEMRNTAIADAFEPGSTFKIITLAAGLDSGAINLNSTFHCLGYKLVEGQKIKCWSYRPHGSETLTEGAQNSCNVVFMQIALLMGRDTFYQYIYNFGLGKQMGVGLNGEGTGIVTAPKYVRDIDLARIGFGQSIAVTPLQLLTASAAAINGGSLMKPYIVKAIVDPDGTVVNEYKPEKISQVIKPETSATVRQILLSVVNNGTGRNGQIAGYDVGGKTGTAQKYGPDGKIMQNKHIGSFIAFAPADDPKYIVLVVVDEPNVAVDFGSVVAAPYAKMIMEQALKYGDVPQKGVTGDEPEETVEVPDIAGMPAEQAMSTLHDKGFKYSIEGYGGDVAGQMPKPGFMAAKGSTVLIYLKKADDGGTESQVAMPDLAGHTAVEVNDILESLGLQMKATGIGGLAVGQNPAPGTTIYEGEIGEVEFAFPDTPGDGGTG